MEPMYISTKLAEQIIQENKKLKELLKETRASITEQVFGSPKEQYYKGLFSGKLLAKIDEVLNHEKTTQSL